MKGQTTQESGKRRLLKPVVLMSATSAPFCKWPRTKVPLVNALNWEGIRTFWRTSPILSSTKKRGGEGAMAFWAVVGFRWWVGMAMG